MSTETHDSQRREGGMTMRPTIEQHLTLLRAARLTPARDVEPGQGYCRGDDRWYSVHERRFLPGDAVILYADDTDPYGVNYVFNDPDQLVYVVDELP